MEIFEGHRALFRPLVSPAIALGNFDGVHCGHQRLLAEAVRAAGEQGGDSVAFTFDPHPARVLAPALAPPLLTSRTRKLELIARAGIAACVVEPFTLELAAIGPDQFLHSILCATLGVRHVVVGYDFTYGHKRAGTAETLCAYGKSHGFTVQVIEPVAVDDLVASSTRIRELLSTGAIDRASRLLGRPYDVDGVVVPGAGRGRTIGIPTANLDVAGVHLPAGGVYAVQVTLLAEPGNDRFGGVANLGRKPTFEQDGAMTLEVHILDFPALSAAKGADDGKGGQAPDLYGQLLRVEFVTRLRDEQRFSGVDALVAQIHADIERGRAILAGREAP